MSNAALLLDYLFVGALLQARLREQVPALSALGAVEGIESLAQASEKNITAPKVFLLWEGERFDTGPQGSALGGATQIVGQQWSALLAVRNAAQNTPDARNSAAGPLMSAIHKAIAGWTPPGGFRPFRRTQGRKPNYTANVGLYPLTFELSLHL